MPRPELIDNELMSKQIELLFHYRYYPFIKKWHCKVTTQDNKKDYSDESVTIMEDTKEEAKRKSLEIFYRLYTIPYQERETITITNGN